VVPLSSVLPLSTRESAARQSSGLSQVLAPETRARRTPGRTSAPPSARHF
jgi:hypothetical protein